VIRQLRFHRRRDAQRLVNSAEVIPRHEHCNGRFQIRQLLAEAIRQPREPAKVHPDGEVSNDSPFHELKSDRGFKTIPMFHSGWPFLMYLPAFTIATILLSDCYFVFWYVSPFGQNSGAGAWNDLSPVYRWKIVTMDFSGLALPVRIGMFISRSTGERPHCSIRPNAPKSNWSVERI
jgi:hypothetical protein